MEENFIRYVITLEMLPGKQFSREIVREHVEHLKKLDAENKLVLCGPFQDGKGGMIIIKAKDLHEAHNIAEKDPFVAKGFEKYTLRELELSCKENNHLGIDLP